MIETLFTRLKFINGLITTDLVDCKGKVKYLPWWLMAISDLKKKTNSKKNNDWIVVRHPRGHVNKWIIMLTRSFQKWNKQTIKCKYFYCVDRMTFFTFQLKRSEHSKFQIFNVFKSHPIRAAHSIDLNSFKMRNFAALWLVSSVSEHHKQIQTHHNNKRQM